MSREKDQATPHLSSLVVRPTDSGGGAAAGGGGGTDYETGEVHRDLPPYSRSNRLPDGHGYRMRAGSVSPVRHRNTDRQFSPDFVHPGGPPRGHGFGNGRDPGRYRDYSPPYGRGRESNRFVGRSYDRPGNAPGSFKGENVARSNPNVRSREGDWICHLCNNLNFARREYCNNCKSLRYGSSGSPRRGYAPPPLRRVPGPPMDRSPGRFINGHRSPPRAWARDDPRDFRAGFPHPRYEGRFDRPALDWGHNRDRGRETFLPERRGYERRLPSPPPPPLPAMPTRDQWARDIRKRSRSPIRGEATTKDYRRNMFAGRGRR
nr:RNA-binding protein EWS isoform X1 [Ipomoea batatas]GMC63461.1 RNA-binding protein EWS isoform X1 [Ipomoea batatas]